MRRHVTGEQVTYMHSITCFTATIPPTQTLIPFDVAAGTTYLCQSVLDTSVPDICAEHCDTEFYVKHVIHALLTWILTSV